MKKSGFTLAEALITLGIIGVIAALVLPSLQADTVAAQIGPKLSKAASSFEQANIALLNDEGVDFLMDTSVLTNVNTYMSALCNHMKGTVNGATITTKDGMTYTASNLVAGNFNPNNRNRSRMDLMVDINGANNPNVDAEDRFYFWIVEDGSLFPMGTTRFNGLTHWNDAGGCRNDQVPVDARTCTASILEQNLKVLYR